MNNFYNIAILKGLKIKMKKNVYIGCGENIREGFIHVDIRDLDHVDYVCNAWELSSHIKEVEHIYSRHMLEHLTNYEADRALRDWFKALKTDGSIRVIVPNMDYHAQQWLRAEWNEETLKNKKSDAQYSFAGFWGWQQQCDPWSSDYDKSHWSVHKSGYNKKRMHLLLKRIGYTNITLEVKNDVHLVATATKPKYSGERQVGTKLDEIRLDHKNRYLFASKTITKQDAIVIDAACGVGYGSYILAQNSKVKKINSYDISSNAIHQANRYFADNKINYCLRNLESEDLPIEKTDYFISFETIEHLQYPNSFIKKVSESLSLEGIFIGSTPNEEIMPFIQQNFLFHTRHFRKSELEKLLKTIGFRDIQFFQQKREGLSEIEKIDDGDYIIFIAKK